MLLCVYVANYVYQTYHLKSKDMFKWKTVLLKRFILSQDTMTLQVHELWYI